ncbi:receptor-like protein EIX2 [Mangifera indica]|uniref:receptor-like protein EIX2 n=1 Tax=Mangifera indica TaxID=29780 RepID=UPI001CFB21E9|nr:receptor-like protein EIX2 [Mangifera indica]
MKLTMSVLTALFFLAIAIINHGFCNGSTHMGCIESERQALLRFKQDLIDSSNRLASWTAADGYCCTWTGVICDNFTGHIIELHLGTYDHRTKFGEFGSGGVVDHGNEDEVDWFYVSMAPGFVVGFWSIIGPLAINKQWRYKYCHFLNWLGYKISSVVQKFW